MDLGKLDANFITIGCALNENDSQLLRVGEYFSNKFQLPIKLVHVVEPWMGNYVGMPVGIVPPLWATNKEIMDAQIEEAEKKLKEYTSTINADFVSVTRIHAGDPSKWIHDESQDSAITLVGSGEFTDGVFKRFTTAFQVLSQSERPVCIVPEGFKFNQSGKLNILLSDDLEGHSANAARFTFKLCNKLSPVRLTHVHVTGMTLENLKAGLEMAQAASHSNMSTVPTAEDMFKAARDSIAKALGSRATVDQSEFAAAGNVYDQKILEGHPSDKLEELRKSIDPDIEVFGKHHAFHKKPFSFGRMSFQSMVSAKSLVIVVPS